MFYHLFLVIVIFFFADGSHAVLKVEAPTQVACTQSAREMTNNIQMNVAAQAPYAKANERVSGYLVECRAFNVVAVPGN